VQNFILQCVLYEIFDIFSDNSGIPPAISSIPVLQRFMKFKIGTTRVSIRATDVTGNVGKCTFSITVKGKYYWNVFK